MGFYDLAFDRPTSEERVRKYPMFIDLCCKQDLLWVTRRFSRSMIADQLPFSALSGLHLDPAQWLALVVQVELVSLKVSRDTRHDTISQRELQLYMLFASTRLRKVGSGNRSDRRSSSAQGFSSLALWELRRTPYNSVLTNWDHEGE